MAEYISQGVFRLANSVKIESFAGVAGSKEGKGPLGTYFDKVVEDSHFGKDSWEKAESRFQLEAVSLAVQKAGITKEDIDVICSGDLINQCIGSTYGLRELEIPFLGIYGACSTMAEGLLISSLLTENNVAKRAVAVTSSHFSTAERQFRFPLSYGGQRTPTAQWTCTASGAVILSQNTGMIKIVGGCIGKITDMGINDINNMGSAMAPAAAETIRRYLTATNTVPADYDFIVTGDLGVVGSKLIIEFLQKQEIDISVQHRDCGCMIFDNENQDTHCGGSGCGCSASVLCSYFLPMLERGEARNILFTATGALMSPMSLQQGESIPSIAHLVHLRKD
ncbi:MAG: stage V sporulation protein AD [Ruminococcus sp.]|nr:stage V sporulation protein AD [Ruminococcus sp.]MDE7137970.1 stage V sporulation protein AD [Ruminococcus sp.]